MHGLDLVCRLASLTASWPQALSMAAHAVPYELVHASSQLLPSTCCSSLTESDGNLSSSLLGCSQCSKEPLKLAAPVLPMQVLKSSCKLC